MLNIDEANTAYRERWLGVELFNTVDSFISSIRKGAIKLNSTQKRVERKCEKCGAVHPNTLFHFRVRIANEEYKIQEDGLISGRIFSVCMPCAYKMNYLGLGPTKRSQNTVRHLYSGVINGWDLSLDNAAQLLIQRIPAIVKLPEPTVKEVLIVEPVIKENLTTESPVVEPEAKPVALKKGKKKAELDPDFISILENEKHALMTTCRQETFLSIVRLMERMEMQPYISTIALAMQLQIAAVRELAASTATPVVEK
jgi:hypothetical protein